MKNTLNKIIAVIAMLSMLTSVTGCGTTVQTENSSETVSGEMTQTMPAPFSDGSDIGGDEHSSFYQPCRGTLDNIPVELMRLRDETEVSSWIDSFTPIDTTAPDSITEYANIFSFISNFNITKDEAESALSVYLNTDDEQIKITHDELDLILSGDIKAITNEFASDYSIVSGENIYAPSWVYFHSADDYNSAGVTAADLAEKVELYAEMGFTNSAKVAFEAKLSEFLGKPIVLSEEHVADSKTPIINDLESDIGIEEDE